MCADRQQRIYGEKHHECRRQHGYPCEGDLHIAQRLIAQCGAIQMLIHLIIRQILRPVDNRNDHHHIQQAERAIDYLAVRPTEGLQRIILQARLRNVCKHQSSRYQWCCHQHRERQQYEVDQNHLTVLNNCFIIDRKFRIKYIGLSQAVFTVRFPILKRYGSRNIIATWRRGPRKRRVQWPTVSKVSGLRI